MIPVLLRRAGKSLSTRAVDAATRTAWTLCVTIFNLTLTSQARSAEGAQYDSQGQARSEAERVAPGKKKKRRRALKGRNKISPKRNVRRIPPRKPSEISDTHLETSLDDGAVSVGRCIA